ncbi:AQJ64_40280 family protein [Streptomyces sp. NPDC012450]|uniref:AQJ64_40280 family protein n=1 Tax=Streptomyces sp. NPDC012450 TaxID=3364834 RepID=UPI0036ED053A
MAAPCSFRFGQPSRAVGSPTRCRGRGSALAGVPAHEQKEDLPRAWARVEGTNLNTVVTWVDVRERLPRSGIPVAAAITGRCPVSSAPESGTASGEEFWLVRPVYFTTLHWSEDGAEHGECFVDSDGVVRLPHGLTSAETVTHRAELPALPGRMTHAVLGEDVPSALQNAWDAHPIT